MGCNYEYKGAKNWRKVSTSKSDSLQIDYWQGLLNALSFLASLKLRLNREIDEYFDFHQQKWKYKQTKIVKNSSNQVYPCLCIAGKNHKAEQPFFFFLSKLLLILSNDLLMKWSCFPCSFLEEIFFLQLEFSQKVYKMLYSWSEGRSVDVCKILVRGPFTFFRFIAWKFVIYCCMIFFVNCNLCNTCFSLEEFEDPYLSITFCSAVPKMLLSLSPLSQSTLAYLKFDYLHGEDSCAWFFFIASWIWHKSPSYINIHKISMHNQRYYEWIKNKTKRWLSPFWHLF